MSRSDLGSPLRDAVGTRPPDRVPAASEGGPAWKLLGLALCLASAALMVALLWWPISAIAGAPEPHGKPILECADGSWVDSRAPGACYWHGGLPNEGDLRGDLLGTGSRA